MFSRCVGVEIELNGYGTKSYCGQFVQVDVGRIPLLTGWKFVADASCGIEFVSPPVVSMEPVVRQVEEILKVISLPDFDNTGLHIHVGVPDFTKSQAEDVQKFCRHFDRAIFSLMHKKRFNSEYCRIVGNGANHRYVGCNIQSLRKHGTIEFRYAEGTLDLGRISALIDLYTSIVDYVKTHGSFVKGAPRSTKMKREFLLDLVGVSPTSRAKLLIEFETLRQKFKLGQYVIINQWGTIGRVEWSGGGLVTIRNAYNSARQEDVDTVGIYGPAQMRRPSMTGW